MPKQVIDKDRLIEHAYSIAAREGISELSVRKLAAACGIAVGSVYMYFPTKADLTAAVFARFFGQALFEECCRVDGNESFIDYVRKLRGALGGALAQMDVDWFAEMRRLPRSEHEALEAARGPMLAHMEQGLQYVLDGDPAVVRSRLVGALSPEKLCPFVLGAIFTSLMEGSDCEPLFALLDASLYEAMAESRASGCVAAAPIEKKDC
ncbi:Bacterial regulatory proteins, tetR family [Schaalia odontolytica]|uniref:Bacterial regulatory proteins, tetR family n=1 Tax=Schaalia odontolytica TaxID=1660 RepID=A0A6N2QWA6_9ACTO|nr:TetR/AcrR family transcriptional regulator [Actinomyces sp.]